AAPVREPLPERRGHPPRPGARDLAAGGRSAHHRARHRRRMELSPRQQERYARHLLLDDLDQEKLLAAAVRVRGKGAAAHWAARYLAASGIGRLAVDEPAWHDELRGLGPWLRIESAGGGFAVAPE